MESEVVKKALRRAWIYAIGRVMFTLLFLSTLVFALTRQSTNLIQLSVVVLMLIVSSAVVLSSIKGFFLFLHAAFGCITFYPSVLNMYLGSVEDNREYILLMNESVAVFDRLSKICSLDQDVKDRITSIKFHHSRLAEKVNSNDSPGDI